MNKKIIVASLILAGGLFGCSSVADNYHQQMNQPQVQASDSKDRNEVKLNPDAWKNLDITRNTANIWIDKNGDVAHNREDGYMFMRAGIINQGDKAVEIKWRCKFYSAQGIPLGEEDYNKTATDDTGLGWHRMILWPVKSTAHTDDANVMRCVSPSKRATDGRFEVHDLADDMTIYDK